MLSLEMLAHMLSHVSNNICSESSVNCFYSLVIIFNSETEKNEAGVSNFSLAGHGCPLSFFWECERGWVDGATTVYGHQFVGRAFTH